MEYLPWVFSIECVKCETNSKFQLNSGAIYNVKLSGIERTFITCQSVREFGGSHSKCTYVFVIMKTIYRQYEYYVLMDGIGLVNELIDFKWLL